MQYLFQLFTVEAYNVLVPNCYGWNSHQASVGYHILASFFIGCYVQFLELYAFLRKKLFHCMAVRSGRGGVK